MSYSVCPCLTRPDSSYLKGCLCDYSWSLHPISSRFIISYTRIAFSIFKQLLLFRYACCNRNRNLYRDRDWIPSTYHHHNIHNIGGYFTIHNPQCWQFSSQHHKPSLYNNSSLTSMCSFVGWCSRWNRHRLYCRWFSCWPSCGIYSTITQEKKTQL